MNTLIPRATVSIRLASLTVLVASAGFLIGCSEGTPPPTPEPQPAASVDEHDHAAHAEPDATAAHEAHSHGPGPHGGTLVDWGGGKYHAEFVVDHEQRQMMVYILGEDAKTPAPFSAAEVNVSIEALELDLALSPMPQESDPEGKSSRFVATDAKLAEVRDYKGTISGVIENTPYFGEFTEDVHAE